VRSGALLFSLGEWFRWRGMMIFRFGKEKSIKSRENGLSIIFNRILFREDWIEATGRIYRAGQLLLIVAGNGEGEYSTHAEDCEGGNLDSSQQFYRRGFHPCFRW
jgi:hypothetical protein